MILIFVKLTIFLFIGSLTPIRKAQNDLFRIDSNNPLRGIFPFQDGGSNLKETLDDGNIQRVISILQNNIKQWSFIESQLLEPNVNLGMPEIFIPLKHLTTTLEILGNIFFVKNDWTEARDCLERACPLMELLPPALLENSGESDSGGTGGVYVWNGGKMAVGSHGSNPNLEANLGFGGGTEGKENRPNYAEGCFSLLKDVYMKLYGLRQRPLPPGVQAGADSEGPTQNTMQRRKSSLQQSTSRSKHTGPSIRSKYSRLHGLVGEDIPGRGSPESEDEYAESILVEPEEDSEEDLSLDDYGEGAEGDGQFSVEKKFEQLRAPFEHLRAELLLVKEGDGHSSNTGSMKQNTRERRKQKGRSQSQSAFLEQEEALEQTEYEDWDPAVGGAGDYEYDGEGGEYCEAEDPGEEVSSGHATSAVASDLEILLRRFVGEDSDGRRELLRVAMNYFKHLDQLFPEMDYNEYAANMDMGRVYLDVMSSVCDHGFGFVGPELEQWQEVGHALMSKSASEFKVYGKERGGILSKLLGEFGEEFSVPLDESLGSGSSGPDIASRTTSTAAPGIFDQEDLGAVDSSEARGAQELNLGVFLELNPNMDPSGLGAKEIEVELEGTYLNSFTLADRNRLLVLSAFDIALHSEPFESFDLGLGFNLGILDNDRSRSRDISFGIEDLTTLSSANGFLGISDLLSQRLGRGAEATPSQALDLVLACATDDSHAEVEVCGMSPKAPLTPKALRYLRQKKRQRRERDGGEGRSGRAEKRPPAQKHDKEASAALYEESSSASIGISSPFRSSVPTLRPGESDWTLRLLLLFLVLTFVVIAIAYQESQRKKGRTRGRGQKRPSSWVDSVWTLLLGKERELELDRVGIWGAVSSLMYRGSWVVIVSLFWVMQTVLLGLFSFLFRGLSSSQSGDSGGDSSVENGSSGGSKSKQKQKSKATAATGNVQKESTTGLVLAGLKLVLVRLVEFFLQSVGRPSKESSLPSQQRQSKQPGDKNHSRPERSTSESSAVESSGGRVSMTPSIGDEDLSGSQDTQDSFRLVHPSKTAPALSTSQNDPIGSGPPTNGSSKSASTGVTPRKSSGTKHKSSGAKQSSGGKPSNGGPKSRTQESSEPVEMEVFEWFRAETEGAWAEAGRKRSQRKQHPPGSGPGHVETSQQVKRNSGGAPQPRVAVTAKAHKQTHGVPHPVVSNRESHTTVSAAFSNSNTIAPCMPSDSSAEETGWTGNRPVAAVGQRLAPPPGLASTGGTATGISKATKPKSVSYKSVVSSNIGVPADGNHEGATPVSDVTTGFGSPSTPAVNTMSPLSCGSVSGPQVSPSPLLTGERGLGGLEEKRVLYSAADSMSSSGTAGQWNTSILHQDFSLPPSQPLAPVSSGLSDSWLLGASGVATGNSPQLSFNTPPSLPYGLQDTREMTPIRLPPVRNPTEESRLASMWSGERGASDSTTMLHSQRIQNSFLSSLYTQPQSLEASVAPGLGDALDLGLNTSWDTHGQSDLGVGLGMSGESYEQGRQQPSESFLGGVVDLLEFSQSEMHAQEQSLMLEQPGNNSGLFSSHNAFYDQQYDSYQQQYQMEYQQQDYDQQQPYRGKNSSEVESITTIASDVYGLSPNAPSFRPHQL